MNTTQKSKSKAERQKKKKNLINSNVTNTLPDKLCIPKDATLNFNYYSNVMNPIAQLPPVVKTKKKIKKEKRELIINKAACPFLSQIHNLIKAVLNEERRFTAWFTLTGHSNNTTPKKILFVVIPYLSHGILVKNCNKINTPFLAMHQNSIRCSRSFFIKKDSPACFILNSVLLADQHAMSIPPFSTTTTGNGTIDLYKTNEHGLRNLLLSIEKFSSFSYPINYENWRKKFKTQVNQPKLSKLWDITVTRLTCKQCEMLEKDPDLKHLIAIDCEMCITTKGSEVVRISAVTPHLVRHTSIDSITKERKTTFQMRFQIILDTFVKPSAPVLDYLSQYSGVYEEDLLGVTVTLDQVQKELNEIITSETILVGHSLDNDFKCLQIFHPRVIDTSIAYEHPSPDVRHSLKFLAYTYLNKLIIHRRFSAINGHDSVEDAIVSLELALLKSLPATLTNHIPNYVCPLSLCIKTPIHLYDSMIHDFSKHPLLSSSYKFEIPHVKQKTDFGVVQAFFQTFQELKKKKKETQKPFPQFHLCFFRDYQKKLHSMIGSIPEEYRAHDFYNINERISMFISTCVANLESKERMNTPQKSLQQNIKASGELFNWLSPLISQTMSQETFAFNETLSEIHTDTGDSFGTQWCDNLLRKRPIINKDVLFPLMNDTDTQNYLSTLDRYLFILNSHLSEGDLMVVSSVCNNPIPYIGLSQLRNVISRFSCTEKLALKDSIDPSFISFSKIHEKITMQQPITLCILK